MQNDVLFSFSSLVLNPEVWTIQWQNCSDTATRPGSRGPFHTARALVWSWLAGWTSGDTVELYDSATLVPPLDREDRGGTRRGEHRAEH